MFTIERATFKGQNMLPNGEHFIHLIVALIKTWFLYVETYSTVQFVFDKSDTK